MDILPSALVGRILGIDGRRIRLWCKYYGLQLDLKNSAEVSVRLLVAAGTVSALTSFMPAFLSFCGRVQLLL